MKTKIFENIGGNQFRLRENLDSSSDFAINLKGKLTDLFEKHKNEQSIPHGLFDELIIRDFPSFENLTPTSQERVLAVEDDIAGSYGFVYDEASDSYIKDTNL